ncbi:hypothetical protein [Rothia sp. HMSC069D01]|uniref:hypothetical protein n=1 Tax=Rothia sp. HMSC069D01 TaxID=1715189 RepID=UPI0008A1FB7C|nr:hypothetical protein [Rothia sp. HMSC069D01]
MATTNHRTYRPNNSTYSALAELVAPYSLSRIQLTEAVGIVTKPTVNTWVKQCCPNLPQGAPVPLAPILRYLHETHLPDPKKWPGSYPYDRYILENITARMLARVVAATFSTDHPHSSNYRELLALIATLVLLAGTWGGSEETFLTLLNPEPNADAEEELQQSIESASEALHPILNELLVPALRTARGTFTADEAQLLTSYALAAGYYAGAHPHETLNSIHTSLAAADRTNALPDAELIRYVADFLNAGSYATHTGSGLTGNHAEQRNLILHGSYASYETASHLVAYQPQAHQAIAFSATGGNGSGALADERRAAFTLYLCYLLLTNEDSAERQAADLYHAERWATQQSRTAGASESVAPEPAATLPEAPANHLIILPLDTPAGSPDDLAAQQEDAWVALEDLAYTVDENIGTDGAITYPVRAGERLAVLAPLDVLAGFGRHLKAAHRGEETRQDKLVDDFLTAITVQPGNHGMRLRAVIDLGPEHLKVNTKTRLGLGLFSIFATGTKPQGSVYLGSLDDEKLYTLAERSSMPVLTSVAELVANTARGYLERGEIGTEDITRGVIVASDALKNASFDELHINPVSNNTPEESLSLLTSLTRDLPALLEILPTGLPVSVPHLRTPEDERSIPHGEEYDITINQLIKTEKVLTKITGRQITGTRYGDVENNKKRIRVLDAHALGHYARYGVLPAESHYLRALDLTEGTQLTQANDIVIYPAYDQAYGGPAVYLSEHGGEAIGPGMTVLRFRHYTPSRSSLHATSEYVQRAQLLTNLLRALLNGLAEGTALRISTHLAPEKRKTSTDIKGWEKQPLPHIDGLAWNNNDLEWFSEKPDDAEAENSEAAGDAPENADAYVTHPVARYLTQELNAFDEVEAALAEALQHVRAVRGRYERDLMANRLDLRSTWEADAERKRLEAEEAARIRQALKALAAEMATSEESTPGESDEEQPH